MKLQVGLLKVSVHVLPQEPEAREPGQERSRDVSQRINNKVEDPFEKVKSDDKKDNAYHSYALESFFEKRHARLN